MYFLFSGEGATDMGKGTHSDRMCEGADYEPGPMALLVDQLIANQEGFSPVGQNRCGFIPKEMLMKKAKNKRPGKKGMTLPGKKRRKETGYFYRAAYAFGVWANDERKKKREQVVAVLFRDSDSHASSERGEWSYKWNSMINGFVAAGFDCGVSMLPKPISEAWLLCALKKKSPYNNCAALEKRSSSPKAPNPLKQELNNACGGDSSRSRVCALVEQKKVDARRIDMPSFNAFKKQLLTVV